MRRVAVLRWAARILGALNVVFFVWLFIEDGLPLLLFGSSPLRMVAPSSGAEIGE